MGPSGVGTGLLRVSFRLEVDDVGVAWAEPEGDWVDEPARGDAVPEEESFFLASLLPSRSLLRESCSCCQMASIRWRRSCRGLGGFTHNASTKSFHIPRINLSLSASVWRPVLPVAPASAALRCVLLHCPPVRLF